MIERLFRRWSWQTECGPKSADALTGLGTRSAIEAIPRGSAIGVVDLLHFRDRVNDDFGHLVGDSVLRVVAGRLRDGLAPLRVFRSGGDEFLIEILEPLLESDAAILAKRIAELVAEPIDGIDRPLECRIGITLRRVADDVLPVRIEADRAAYQAALTEVPYVVFQDGTEG